MLLLRARLLLKALVLGPQQHIAIVVVGVGTRVQVSAALICLSKRIKEYTINYL